MEFVPFATWYLGEEMIIEYKIPHKFTESKFDWIGIYKANFTNLDDYVTWRTTYPRKPPPGQTYTPIDGFYEYQLKFSDAIELEAGELYQLVYFRRTSSRSFESVAGIGEPFTAGKRGK